MRSEANLDALPWWATRVPFLLVLFSLLALAAIPLLIQRRIELARQEIIATAEPALRLVDRIQLALALEVSAVRGYLLTGDDRFIERYRRAVADEAHAFARLAPLARRLGPAFQAGTAELRTLGIRWTAPADSLLAGLIPPQRFVARMPAEQAILEARALAAMRLRELMTQDIAVRLQRIADVQRLATVLTTLVLLALVAALFVERLGARFRAAAGRFQQQAREEAALRRAAQAVASASTVDEVLRRIAESALDAVGGDAALVNRMDRARDEVEVAAAAGAVEARVGTRFPYRGSFTEAVVVRGEPQLVARATVEASSACRAPDAGGSAGEALGVLQLLRGHDRPPFQAQDVARARAFADLAAVSFHKLALFRESEERRLDLERTTESRARLMRGFGHDVKNPLGAAEGYAQLLEEGLTNGLTPRQKESVRKIRSSIRSALRLIDDLLDIARAEAGRLQLRREPVDLRTLAAETVEEFRAAALAKSLALEARAPERDLVIRSDEGRIRQILGNLIANAIRHTPERGRVTVRVAPGEEGRAPWPGRWVGVAVSDSGPGIPEQQREAVFQEFTRVQPGAGAGAGIGLAISRTLARALGGEITLESAVGRGSNFTLWLPLTAAPAQSSGHEAAA
jgi:signal transduction histidine kinase/CHASE3 domain sensor protein